MVFKDVYKKILVLGRGRAEGAAELDGEIEIFRCKTCGWITSAEPEGAIGTIHAHAEKHTGFLSIGNFQKLDKHVQKLKISDYKEVQY